MEDIMICLCGYCNKEIEVANKKVFANHVRWCDANKTNGDKGKSNVSASLKEMFKKTLGLPVELEFSCLQCNSTFLIATREFKNLSKNRKKFCSITCSNKHNGSRSEETKQKISEKLSGRRKSGKTVIKENRTCQICQSQFEDWEDSDRKTCSISCGRKLASITRYQQCRDRRSPLAKYRANSIFKFNLADFPEEFDFSLVESYGWYKAKNHGNNLNGVSRDHMISVMFGFTNNIDASIISHPANCRLVRHNENASKGSKCAITLEELMGRIEAWNLKYSK